MNIRKGIILSILIVAIGILVWADARITKPLSPTSPSKQAKSDPATAVQLPIKYINDLNFNIDDNGVITISDPNNKVLSTINPGDLRFWTIYPNAAGQLLFIDSPFVYDNMNAETNISIAEIDYSGSVSGKIALYNPKGGNTSPSDIHIGDIDIRNLYPEADLNANILGGLGGGYLLIQTYIDDDSGDVMIDVLENKYTLNIYKQMNDCGGGDNPATTDLCIQPLNQ